MPSRVLSRRIEPGMEFGEDHNLFFDTSHNDVWHESAVSRQHSLGEIGATGAAGTSSIVSEELPERKGELSMAVTSLQSKYQLDILEGGRDDIAMVLRLSDEDWFGWWSVVSWEREIRLLDDLLVSILDFAMLPL